MKFKQFLDGEIEDRRTDYFEIGTAIHMYFLEPAKFKKKYEVLDYTSPSSKNQITFVEKLLEYGISNKAALVKAYKESYTVNKLSDDKILEKAKEIKSNLKDFISYKRKLGQNKAVLSTLDMKLIQGIETSIKSHKKASKLLYDLGYELIEDDNKTIYNEKEVYWSLDINNTKLDFKAMIDRLVIDHANKVINLIDLKTTKSLSSFLKSFKTYNYDRQLAFYSLAVKELFEQEFTDLRVDDYTIKFYIVAADKTDSHVRTYDITEQIINKALIEIKHILQEIEWHVKNNKWDHPKEYYLNDGAIEICEAILQDL